MLNILFLEPFFGGSHKDFALGFKENCPHAVELITLPDRFWKWRMRGAALYFSHRIQDVSSYDLIIATDMMDVADFSALVGSRCPPIWLYFHENQLAYPVRPGQKRDFHLGFTNIVSALAADQVIFNSSFHMNGFMEEAEKLIQKMPDFKPGWAIDTIRDKARVIYPGCRFDSTPVDIDARPTEAPLIIWNHRWEHDKNPELFFNGLACLKEKKYCIPLGCAW
jgi:glycosyltransferase involved in cell wall biosynthesis